MEVPSRLVFGCLQHMRHNHLCSISNVSKCWKFQSKVQLQQFFPACQPLQGKMNTCWTPQEKYMLSQFSWLPFQQRRFHRWLGHWWSSLGAAPNATLQGFELFVELIFGSEIPRIVVLCCPLLFWNLLWDDIYIYNRISTQQAKLTVISLAFLLAIFPPPVNQHGRLEYLPFCWYIWYYCIFSLPDKIFLEISLSEFARVVKGGWIVDPIVVHFCMSSHWLQLRISMAKRIAQLILLSISVCRSMSWIQDFLVCISSRTVKIHDDSMVKMWSWMTRILERGKQPPRMDALCCWTGGKRYFKRAKTWSWNGKAGKERKALISWEPKVPPNK